MRSALRLIPRVRFILFHLSRTAGPSLFSPHKTDQYSNQVLRELLRTYIRHIKCGGAPA